VIQRILVLRDKKPGHARQADGLALAIAGVTGARIDAIEVRARWFAHETLRRVAIRAGMKPRITLRAIYGSGYEDICNPDLVIASGRPTIAAGIALARAHGARLVYLGRIQGYDPLDFAAVIEPFPDRANTARHVYAPIPSPLGRELFPSPRRLVDESRLAGAEIACLIGGPSSTHGWHDADWDRLCRLISATAARYGIRWSLSTSRRTPHAAAKRFAQLAADGHITRFIDFAKSGPGSANSLFGADAVVVTEDSMSMISEAIAAGRPVVGLRPRKVRASSIDELMAAMAASGSLKILPLTDTEPTDLARALIEAKAPIADPRQAILRAIAPLIGLDLVNHRADGGKFCGTAKTPAEPDPVRVVFDGRSTRQKSVDQSEFEVNAQAPEA
jgi:mitochondrial fission protein ELM1